MRRLVEGETIARFRVECFIAGGGMGEVYRATDLNTGREVALKLLAVAGDDGLARRFSRERAVATAMEHQGIVPVYETGVDGASGQQYIAMRLVEGSDLAAVLASGPLEPARAVDILGQVAEALDAAHDRGLVHRDVKPGNILLEVRGGREAAYLSDFGLARELVVEQRLSVSGGLLGTPAYMAPEVAAGGSSDARGDVYALGCVLFEMLAGRVPFVRESEVATVWAHVNDDPPRLADVAPDLPTGFDPVIRRALAKEPEDRYGSAGELAAAAARALNGELSDADVAVPERAASAAPRCPYRGLAAFEAGDAEFYFGREELIAELVARLRTVGFLGVVGASGSGKSSLVRAGLLPALGQASSVITPGARPLASLGDARPDTVLAVDQFEELFTLCSEEAARERFVARLLARASPVVIVVRGDFYGRCSQYPALAEALERSQALLGPMPEPALREAIVKPAQRVGLHVEHRLLEAVVRDVAGQPAALPLLSHALLETWNRRVGRTLTLAGYLEAGGVQGALAHTAQTLYDTLDDEDRRLARSIFLRLTALGEGTEDTRRRVEVRELVLRADQEAAVGRLLDRFAAARLISLDDGSVEIAHEALIRHWPTLQAWLNEDREARRIHRRVTEAASEWEALGREPGALWRGGRLVTAAEWADAHADALNELEGEFVAASRQAEETELARVRRRNRRLRALVVALAVLLAAAAVAATVAVRQTGAARTQQAAARSQAQVAQKQQQIAQQQSRVALSRGLAGTAQALLTRRLDLALLVALEADRAADTTEARDALLAAVQRTSGLKAILSGDAVSARRVAISRNGQVVAVLDDAGRLSVWHAASPRAPVVIQVPVGAGHLAPSLAVSPDGAEIVAVTDGGNIWFIDSTARNDPFWLSTGGYDVPERSLLACSFSADGSHVIAVFGRSRQPNGGPVDPGSLPETVVFTWEAGPDDGQAPGGTERSWSTSAGASGLAIAGYPLGAVLAEGGAAVALDGPKDVKVANTASGRTIGTIATTVASRDGRPLLALSADGSRLAGVDAAGAVTVWDVTGGGATAVSLPVMSTVDALALPGDGRRLVLGMHDGAVRTLDAATGQPVGLEFAGHTAGVIDIAASATAVASIGGDGLVLLHPAAGGDGDFEHVLATAPTGDAVATSPDGSLVAMAGDDGVVRIVDATTGARSATLSGPAGPTAAAFGRDGRSVTVAGGGGGQVRLWDLGSQPPVSRSAGTYAGSPLAFSPDGAYVASWAGDETGDVVVQRPGAPAPRPFAASLPKRPLAAAFSPDSSRLAAGFTDGAVDLIDPTNPDAKGTELTGHRGQVNDVAYSPDGQTLASVSSDGTLRLWPARDATPVSEPLSGGSGQLYGVAFVDGGRVVATLGENALRFWDVARRVPLGDGVPFRRGAGSFQLEAAPGAASAIVAGDLVVRVDGLLWTDDPARLGARVCQLVGRSLTPAEFEQYEPGGTYREQCRGSLPASG